jgi:hypothetical protein
MTILTLFEGSNQGSKQATRLYEILQGKEAQPLLVVDCLSSNENPRYHWMLLPKDMTISSTKNESEPVIVEIEKSYFLKNHEDKSWVVGYSNLEIPSNANIVSVDTLIETKDSTDVATRKFYSKKANNSLNFYFGENAMRILSLIHGQALNYNSKTESKKQ